MTGSSGPSPSGPTASAWRPSGTRGRSGSGTPAAGGRSGPSAWTRETGRLEGGLSWSPDGRRLASAAEDGLVRIWDPETGRETARIAQKARSVAWSPDGTRIALGLVVTSGWRSAPGTPGPSGCEGRSSGNGAGSTASAWSPDSRRLAAISDLFRRGLAQVAADRLGRHERREGLPGRPRRGAAIDRLQPRRHAGGDGRRGGGSCGCSTRRMAGSTPPCSPGPSDVTGLAFSPDGRRLYAAGWGMGGVKVFDPARDPRGRRRPGLARADRGPDLRSRGPPDPRHRLAAGGMLASADPVDRHVRRDRAVLSRDGLPPLAPRGLRLQSRRRSAGGADATGPGRSSGSGTWPSGGRSPRCGDRAGRSRPSRSAPTAGRWRPRRPAGRTGGRS